MEDGGSADLDRVLVDAHAPPRITSGRMSAAAPSTPVLCLGEVFVDLVCEEPVLSMSQARTFVPHFGGSGANMAVIAARAGAPVAFAGMAGEDGWGRWLSDRLATEGVDTSHLVFVPGAQTAVAFVAVDPEGALHREVYAPPPPTADASLTSRIETAVEASAGLLIAAECLTAEPERALAMRARERALEQELPVVVDAGLAADRFSSRADAAASANACVPEATLVRAGHDDAELMTGEADPERAALALRKAGARLVAITFPDGSAILRGAERADVAAAPGRMRSRIGAADHFTATLLARLALSRFYPAAAAVAMREAARAAAEAHGRWGTLD